MKKLLTTLLVCLSPVLVHAQSVAGRSLTAPTTKDVAYVSQEVLLTGESTTTVTVAPLTTSTSGFGLKKLPTKMQGSPIGSMPIMAIANPTTQAAALSAAKEWTELELPVFKSKFNAWMNSKQISVGFFNYTQEIMVTTLTGPKKQAVAFNISIDVSGRPTFGNPKIVDPDPTIVEAIYTPKGTAAGLPDTWKYPDAGTIKWRVLNKKYVPLSGWTTVDVNGAFDEKETDTDPDAPVGCLMDRTKGSCSGPTDMATIMNNVGSQYALVNYIRKVQPDYHDDGAGNQTPSAAISVDERTWNCTSYNNKGHYGFVLALMVDQYMAQASASKLDFQKVGQMGGKGISPTEPYDKTVPVADLNGVNPDTVIISPIQGDNSLWSRNDATLMANVVYVAPVVAAGGDGELSNASFSGDMAVRDLSPAGGTTREYYIGTVGDNYWGSGIYDRSVTFNLKSPESTEMFAITQVGFDDWLLVTVNGTTVYLGPKGGDMLEVQSGVHQDVCAYQNGRYVCAGASNEFVSYPTYDWNDNYTCPSGTLLKVGPVPNASWDSGGQGWGCFKASSETFKYCEAQTFWSGDSENSNGYLCTQGCAPGMVQYLSTASGWGAGCGWPELKTSWNIPVTIDLRPYLKTGSNTIFTRTVVAGNGESWMRIKTRSCGASLNLATENPAVPVTGGAGGVSTSLTKKMLN